MGQNRHLKLRLSKGSAQFDGIFFSAVSQTCGVAAGSRVDAAFYLQVNEFRGNRSVQLQMVDIRPSLMPSRNEADALALLQRLLCGEGVSAQETARLLPSREQFKNCWVTLERHLHQGKADEAHLPFLRTLASYTG